MSRQRGSVRHTSSIAGGAGAARTGVAIAAPHAPKHDPVSIVRQAADVVLHPGLMLLALIAITALTALGMLTLVASLGRRTQQSG